MLVKTLRLLAASAAASLVGTAADVRHTTQQRIAEFPTEGLPLRAPATVYWSDQMVPFIDAASDHDAAVLLGAVHAHLRLGQMELVRRVSQGRLAESFGGFVVDLDHALRILDFGRAAPAVEAALPEATRAWLEAYVSGINAYQARMRRVPVEFGILSAEPAPWTLREVLTLGRLLSIDINWLVHVQAATLRAQPGGEAVWRRLFALGSQSSGSTGPAPAAAAASPPAALRALRDVVGDGVRGSNSFALSGARTASGAPLLANDPHLGLSLPNTWVIVGLRSPSLHAVGLMFPGVPFVALGRNPHGAWGGTNLRAASSDLYDLTGVPAEQITERTTLIRDRFWFNRERTLRDTPWGPVVTDAPAARELGLAPAALRWVGHEASDEYTAFLAANRARSFAEFRAALAGFAVPSQAMLWADNTGAIGLVNAARVPERGFAYTDTALVRRAVEPGDQWGGRVDASALPAIENPAEGFIASANNRPVDDGRIGFFFSPNDRVDRLRGLLAGARGADLDFARALQTDTYSPSSVRLRDAFVAKLSGVERARVEGTPLWRAITGWNGRYDVDSAGAVAFILLVDRVGPKIVETRFGLEEPEEIVDSEFFLELLAAEVEAMEPAALAEIVRGAVGDAARSFRRYPTWGELHQIGTSHALARVPILGSGLPRGQVPVPGSANTLWKSAHPPSSSRHRASYGANARHVSDLADVDANHFVLFGGQDGDPFAANFADQVDLFLRGAYLRIPLRIETVAAEFPHRTEVR